MIPPSESVSDFIEGSFRMTAGKVHRDLPRESDVCRPALAGHIRETDIEMFSDFFLDLIDCYRFFRLFLQNISQQLFDSLTLNLSPA